MSKFDADSELDYTLKKYLDEKSVKEFELLKKLADIKELIEDNLDEFVEANLLEIFIDNGLKEEDLEVFRQIYKLRIKVVEKGDI